MSILTTSTALDMTLPDPLGFGGKPILYTGDGWAEFDMDSFNYVLFHGTTDLTGHNIVTVTSFETFAGLPDAINALTGCSVDFATLRDLYLAQNFTAAFKLFFTGADTITGSSAADKLDGFGGNDILRGGAGNDKLYGETGSDQLYGGSGRDVLYGGPGRDTLTGGGWSDQFVFNSIPALNNADNITDFTHAVDKIVLDHTVFTALAAGSLSGDDFTAGTSATNTAAHIIYNSATGNLLYNADGTGPKLPALLAHVTPGTILDAGDFRIV